MPASPAKESLPAKPIPLSVPWVGEAETSRLREALAGRLAGDGPFTRRVERRLADRLGGPRGLLTTSCTHALQLALLALGVGAGGEGGGPAVTFVSPAKPVLRGRARP